MIIYSFGYNSNSFSYFQQIVDKLDAIVIDVRYSPSSYSPFWKKKYLQETFKNYKHIKNLGNVKYNIEGQIEILNLKDGVNEVLGLMDLGFNCILLCACEDINKCHRKIVAEEVSRISGCEIKHL